MSSKRRSTNKAIGLRERFCFLLGGDPSVNTWCLTIPKQRIIKSLYGLLLRNLRELRRVKTRMNDQSWKRKRTQRAVPGSRVRKNQRDRARDQWSPRLSNCHLLLKDKGETMKAESGKWVSPSRLLGILAIWPIPDKEFFGYLRLLPSFSVSERTVSMDSHSFQGISLGGLGRGLLSNSGQF
jgi:hypothetical protein